MPTLNAPHSGRRQHRGFTVFETIIAMFILLFGLLGVVAVFGSGMQARMMAQELTVSGELATMWSDWIRFRLAESTDPVHDISLGALADAEGSFYTGEGSFKSSDPNGNLPTIGCSPYQGYRWAVTKVEDWDGMWREADGTEHKWTERKDGAGVFSGGTMNFYPNADPTKNLTVKQVKMVVYRGTRINHEFVYLFSGVKVKYE